MLCYVCWALLGERLTVRVIAYAVDDWQEDSHICTFCTVCDDMTAMMYRTEAIFLSILSVMSKLTATVRFMVLEHIKTFTHSKTTGFKSHFISPSGQNKETYTLYHWELQAKAYFYSLHTVLISTHLSQDASEPNPGAINTLQLLKTKLNLEA
jgi:hypothetical protein